MMKSTDPLKTFFSDLKVVELASVLAGPAVGMFFAELGARVIKIENRLSGGDITRKWKLPQEDPDRSWSAYFCSVNWKKRSVQLDLNTGTDRRMALDLIREADVVISNLRESSALRLGMDFPNLIRVNPRLIFGQLTGFGKDDERPAFDMVVQAETGYLSMCGHPGQPPAKIPVALLDVLAAHQLKEAILLGLLRRSKTGTGCRVEVSLFESAIASLANQASNFLVAGHIPGPMGTRHPNIAPYGDLFTSSDGKQLILAVGSDRQFEALCRCLHLEGLPSDVDFSTNTARVRNRNTLQVALQDAIGRISLRNLERLFRTASVPYGRIRDMAEVFEQARASTMILEEQMEEGGLSRRVATVAFEMEPK